MHLIHILFTISMEQLISKTFKTNKEMLVLIFLTKIFQKWLNLLKWTLCNNFKINMKININKTIINKTLNIKNINKMVMEINKKSKILKLIKVIIYYNLKINLIMLNMINLIMLNMINQIMLNMINQIMLNMIKQTKLNNMNNLIMVNNMNNLTMVNNMNNLTMVNNNLNKTMINHQLIINMKSLQV